MPECKYSLASQYHAALAMLRQAIDKCPAASEADLWYSGHTRSGHPVAYWHIAYHVIFYTHLYLMPTENDFQPWAKTRANYNFLGPLPWPPHEMPKIDEPYSRTEILEYLQFVDDMVDDAVDALDLDEPEDCGFWWYNPMSKLEHQLVNIRHVQHHAAQLADRLRAAINEGVDWKGRQGASK